VSTRAGVASSVSRVTSSVCSFPIAMKVEATRGRRQCAKPHPLPMPTAGAAWRCPLSWGAAPPFEPLGGGLRAGRVSHPWRKPIGARGRERAPGFRPSARGEGNVPLAEALIVPQNLGASDASPRFLRFLSVGSSLTLVSRRASEQVRIRFSRELLALTGGRRSFGERSGLQPGAVIPRANGP
jgi:hypothetical protein